MLNFINTLMFIEIDTSNIVDTLIFLLLGMVLMFIVMTVIYAAIRLLNFTDKNNDKIKTFWSKTIAKVKNLFGGKGSSKGSEDK